MPFSTRARRAAWHRAPYAVVSIPVEDVEAATDTGNNEPLIVFAEDVELVSILFVPDAARAGANTDTRTIVVRNLGDEASGDDDIASFEQTDGNDLAAYVPQEIAIAQGEGSVSAGDVLVYRSVKVGSGLITPAGTFVITYN